MSAADVRSVQEDNQEENAQGDQEKLNCLNMEIDGEENVSKSVKVDQFNLQAGIVREKHDTNDTKGLKMSFKRDYSTDRAVFSAAFCLACPTAEVFYRRRWDAMLIFENGQTTVKMNKFFDRMPDEPLLLECKMGVLQHMVHKERDFTVPDEYSDIMFTCDGKEFHVSREFISTWSEFLRGLFTSDMKEATDKKYDVEFLKHEEMSVFLNFVHPMTGLRVYYEILPTLLYTADALLAPRVTFLCEKFLLRDYDDRRQHLLASELLEMLELADNWRLKVLRFRIICHFQTSADLKKAIMNHEKYSMFSEDAKKLCTQRHDDLVRRESGAKKETKEGEEEDSDTDSSCSIHTAEEYAGSDEE